MIQAATAAAMAFNLVCSGTTERHDLQGNAREPYSMTLRIDLNRRQWCENECTSILDISDVSATQITLQEDDSGPGAFRMRTSNFINRVTGEHHEFINTEGRFSGGSVSSWQGTCAPAPFSGFPTVPTKF